MNSRQHSDKHKSVQKSFSPASQENIVKKILRDIEDAEWDEMLTSQSLWHIKERVLKEIEEDIATGNTKKYFTVDDLESIFKETSLGSG